MLAHPANVRSVNTCLDGTDGHGAKMSPRNHHVPSLKSQVYVIYPTNPAGALDDGVEDRLHVRGRAADDAKHLGGCRLISEPPQFRCILDLFSFRTFSMR
jgi:hypothetical protein